MKLFEKIGEVLGLTTSERRVIMMLMAAFLAGWGINLVRGSHQGSRVFDYAAVDSEFAARSGAYASAGVDSFHMDLRRQKPPLKEERSVAAVNINTASKEELIGLPGIGEAMAERIILYREDHGPFGTVEELGRVKGIGKKKLERLVPLCTTGK